MMRLVADFKADWLVMVRQHLAERWGPEHIPDDDVLPKFFDSLRRRRALAGVDQGRFRSILTLYGSLFQTGKIPCIFPC
jgi:hypothetical protein